jgi:ABC-type uncharacterized transport system permease subunit
VSAVAEVLFWPALLAYGEAAIAYVVVLRRPEVATRLAIWGVRIGWLAQTGLLAAEAVRADGFPWASWSGLLNLFVWLAVGVYLIWGCSPRYRLLGLAVMPAAVLLFAVAGLGGAASEHSSDLFVAVHVGLVLSGFAGFALAAAISALYLWQERRLKRHAAGVLRLGPPSLLGLDRLATRTTAVSFVFLSAGIGLGLARGHPFDLAVAGALAAWAVFAAALLLRRELGWSGRRAAYLTVAGFALVALLGLPAGHFV